MQLLGILHSLADIVSPPICPICHGELFHGQAGVCDTCEEALPHLPTRLCRGCGGPNTGLLELCLDCLAVEGGRPWELAVSAFPFHGVLREALHHYKYHGQVWLAPYFGHRMASAWLARKERPAIDVITYIPLHYLRYLSRGYNQAELLARQISRELGIPCQRLLLRKQSTRQQARLDLQHRQSNVKKAFRVCHPGRFQKQSILLVDDVFTTGSTLSAAAKLLLQAGAARVSVLTLARD